MDSEIFGKGNCNSRSSACVDFYFVPATDCASAALHWSLTLPMLFRMQLRSLPGQLSFTSVVQALLISATRASLALHASENSPACVFTQSLMRRAPGARGGSGDSLGAPRPSWSCQNGKPDESEYSHAENDNCNRGHFDDGKPS